MDNPVGVWWSVLWDSGALAMAVLGPARTYIQVNPAFCRLLKADAATIRAWTYEQIGHPLDLDNELDALVRLAEGAATATYHRRFRTAGAEEFSAEVRLCAGSADQVLMLVIPCEKPCIAGEERLARRLEQIASALSHDALEAVRQAGVQAGLMAARYAAALDERGRATVATIERLAVKSGQQLRGLVTLARLGLPRLAPAPVPMRPLIDAAWSDQRAIPPDTTFMVKLSDEVRWDCDPLQVSLALREILANALTFREPSRALNICVTVSPDPAGTTLRFTISDNGCGIAAIDQPRLFRIYAILGTHAGIGMGLALVRAVAEGHGGEATLTSELGQGTQVQFTLGNAVHHGGTEARRGGIP